MNIGDSVYVVEKAMYNNGDFTSKDIDCPFCNGKGYVVSHGLEMICWCQRDLFIPSFHTGTVSCVITKREAEAFYDKLVDAFGGKKCSGIASAELIADRMNISQEIADEYCVAMVMHRVTERQGGGYVI